MTRPVAVLRPEPGNTATAARVEAAGLRAIRLPLFAVVPLDWMPPDPSRFDALLLTSANALRHGGTGLAALLDLPVVAVGEATARAARAAGFAVTLTGDGDAASVAAQASGRLLHLAGRDHRAVAGATTIAVYAADPLPVDADGLAGCIALLHSPRAATRLRDLLTPAMRARIAIAALSPGVASAAGDGWRVVVASDRPQDAALVVLAGRLAATLDD